MQPRTSYHDARFMSETAPGWARCQIINISGTGAQLRIPAAMRLPREIRLQIPGDLFEARGDVQYQSDTDVEIYFTSNRREALAKYSD